MIATNTIAIVIWFGWW